MVACYLINRLPSRVLEGKSHLAVLLGQDTYLTHLQVFDYLCFVKIQPNLDKFACHSIPSIMMGYSAAKKGYMI